MGALKPAQIRIRVDHEDGELLEDLGMGALSRADVATYLLKAGIRAIRDASDPPVLPSGFKAVSSDSHNNRLNEPSAKDHHKRK